jgi:hypothetical protein
MPMPTLDDAVTLEVPPLIIPWSSTRAEVLALVGKSGVRDATFLGLPFAATFHFDARNVLTRVRFVPPRDPGGADPTATMGEDLETQVKRSGPSIRKRRAALEAALGAGERGPEWPITSRLPCSPMSWHSKGRVHVVHEVAFNVERGGDEIGWLEDYVEVRKVGPLPSP